MPSRESLQKNLEDRWNRLRHLKRLCEQRLGRAALPLQFGLVGASGVVVDLSFFNLFLLFCPFGVSRAAAIWIAMTWNYWLNRRLTFSYSRDNPVIRQYLLFCASSAFGAVMSWSCALLLTRLVLFFAQHQSSAALVGIVAGAFLNYLFCWLIAFGPDRGTKKTPAALRINASNAGTENREYASQQ